MLKQLVGTEKDLLIKLRDGNEQAFGTLYRRYSKSLYHKIIKMIKVEADAEEMLQDLFVKIWNNRADLNPEQSFGSFLHRVTENMVYDYYRRIARDQRLHTHLSYISTEITNNTEEYIHYKDFKALLDAVLDKLPEKRRQAFILCRLEGHSYEEAGQIMGTSPNTIHNHVVRANKDISNYLNTPLFISLLVMLMFMGN